MNDNSLPITGICIVSKANSVPTGYICIRKVFDDSARDADLMPDTFLERKDRFLCITRIYPLADNKTLVLEDIKLMNEREVPPPQYTPLTLTVDTYEKGTTKRIICVKLVERQAGLKCVCDIIFLYRSKRPPQSYTLIGEINGLQMCIKEGIVPTLRAPPPIPTSNLYPNPTSNLYPNPTSNRPYNEQPITPDNIHKNPLAKRNDEKEILDGVPFEINSKYLRKNQNGANDLYGLDSFQILSTYELEQKFYYDFNLERSFI